MGDKNILDKIKEIWSTIKYRTKNIFNQQKRLPEADQYIAEKENAGIYTETIKTEENKEFITEEPKSEVQEEVEKAFTEEQELGMPKEIVEEKEVVDRTQIITEITPDEKLILANKREEENAQRVYGKAVRDTIAPRIQGIEDLVLIHRTNYWPENGIIKTAKNAEALSKELEYNGHKYRVPLARDTVHFAVNGEVSEHFFRK